MPSRTSRSASVAGNATFAGLTSCAASSSTVQPPAAGVIWVSVKYSDTAPVTSTWSPTATAAAPAFE